MTQESDTPINTCMCRLPHTQSCTICFEAFTFAGMCLYNKPVNSKCIFICARLRNPIIFNLQTDSVLEGTVLLLIHWTHLYSKQQNWSITIKIQSWTHSSIISWQIKIHLGLFVSIFRLLKSFELLNFYRVYIFICVPFSAKWWKLVYNLLWLYKWNCAVADCPFYTENFILSSVAVRRVDCLHPWRGSWLGVFVFHRRNPRSS